MPGQALISRVDKHFIRTLTLSAVDNQPGDLSTSPFTLATVTGRVMITHLNVYCSTLLTGATATLELGCAGNSTTTAALIPLTTATLIDAGEFWRDASPELHVSSPSAIDHYVDANIILTTATADVTAGVLEFLIFWRPASANGNLA